VGSVGITMNSAVINWTTEESSDSQVDYGTTSNYGSSSPFDSTMVLSHSVPVSNLAAGTLYHYRVRSKDAAGNLALSPAFTSQPPADTVPPIVSSVAASAITQNSASIFWSTDEPATSQVDYGLTNAYGSSTPLDSNLVLSHSVALSGLASGTVYHY